jgi:hypothetical protein
MFVRIVAAGGALLLASSAGAECTGTGQYDPADLRYICDSERAWSQSVASGDTSAPNRILADDYLGIGSSGRQFTKAEMAAQPSKTVQLITYSDNDYVLVRFFGDTAVNQGRDTIRTKDGHESHLVWTDTWLKRNGKWQMVASQDMQLEAHR